MKHIADVCMYGIRETGAGWLAQIADGTLLGDGTPKPGMDFTTALWKACEHVRLHARDSEAFVRGRVRVFEPGGKRVAEFDVAYPPWYGSLVWEDAPTMNLTAHEVVSAVA